jgi:hypothetical protein
LCAMGHDAQTLPHFDFPTHAHAHAQPQPHSHTKGPPKFATWGFYNTLL